MSVIFLTRLLSEFEPDSGIIEIDTSNGMIVLVERNPKGFFRVKGFDDEGNLIYRKMINGLPKTVTYVPGSKG